jgi:hypothetical protein
VVRVVRVTWAKTGMKAPKHRPMLRPKRTILCPSTCPATLLCLTGNVLFVNCCYCDRGAFITTKTAHCSYFFNGFNEYVIPESEMPKGTGDNEAYILSFSQWCLYKKKPPSFKIDATEVPGIKECSRRLGSEKWDTYVEDIYWGVCRQCSRRIDKVFSKGGVKKALLVFDDGGNLTTVRVYNGKQYWGDWRK